MALISASIPRPLFERRSSLLHQKQFSVPNKKLRTVINCVRGDIQPTAGIVLSKRAVMVGLMASAASAATFMSDVAPADARRIKPETMKRIRERLEELTKKADPKVKEKQPIPSPSLKDLAGPFVEITV
ncbi:uncharacterized protein LOC144700784 [Wolffia australiana]